jgi:hypothetical protein
MPILLKSQRLKRMMASFAGILEDCAKAGQGNPFLPA